MKQISVILLCLMVMLTWGKARGTIFQVEQDGSGDFTMIQPAIEGSTPGDTIFVAPGVYQENVDFVGKDLLVASHFLLSGDPADIATTVITAAPYGGCVRFRGGETRAARLVGFTLRDGWGYYHVYDCGGGGVFVNGASPSLEHLVITDCHGWGAGILIVIGSPLLSSLEIFGNESSGSMSAGGGVAIELGLGTEILDCYIHDNYSRGHGGGISGYFSTIILKNNEIRRNQAVFGGGIFLDVDCNAMFTDNVIAGNTAKRGGGIRIYQHSEADLKGDCITGNHARQGGGLHIGEDSIINFNENTPCSIYGNLGLWGRDIQVESPNIVPVVVDTFSVSQPTGIHVYPPGQATVSFAHPLRPQVDGDIYVATDGDDAAAGTSPDQPLRTIHHALARLAPGAGTVRTIHLAPGTYSPSLTGEVFPQLLPDRTRLVGSCRETTIIDGESTFSGIVCGWLLTEDTGLAVCDLTITGAVNWGAIRCFYAEVTLESLNLTGNSDHKMYSSWHTLDTYTSAAVTCSGGQVALNDCKIQDNFADTWHWTAGAVSGLDGAAIRLERVLVTDNESGSSSGTIILDDNCQVAVFNSTITQNQGGEDSAGVIFRGDGSHLALVNTILWENEGPEISFRGNDLTDTLLVAYSDLAEGQAGIDHHNLGVVDWREGNIDADPQFVDPAGSGNYELSLGSPCIDAGINFFDWGNPLFQLDLNPEDYLGPAPDMGIYEYLPMAAVIDEPVHPRAMLGKPHPNPFNPQTTLKYKLPEQTTVTLSIFDLGGNLVRVLIDGQVHSPGTYTANWDGRNVRGESMSSGVYFIRLDTGELAETGRVTLIR